MQKIIFGILFFCFIPAIQAQTITPKFKVIAFYTARNDEAHISFAHEANRWFPEMAAKYNLFMIQQTTRIILMLNFFHNTRWCFS